MKTWRGYFVIGIILGGIALIVGIYSESVPLRIAGAILPLAGLGLGLAIDQSRSRPRRDH